MHAALWPSLPRAVAPATAAAPASVGLLGAAFASRCRRRQLESRAPLGWVLRRDAESDSGDPGPGPTRDAAGGCHHPKRSVAAAALHSNRWLSAPTAAAAAAGSATAVASSHAEAGPASLTDRSCLRHVGRTSQSHTSACALNGTGTGDCRRHRISTRRSASAVDGGGAQVGDAGGGGGGSKRPPAKRRETATAAAGGRPLSDDSGAAAAPADGGGRSRIRRRRFVDALTPAQLDRLNSFGGAASNSSPAGSACATTDAAPGPQALKGGIRKHVAANGGGNESAGSDTGAASVLAAARAAPACGRAGAGADAYFSTSTVGGGRPFSAASQAATEEDEAKGSMERSKAAASGTSAGAGGIGPSAAAVAPGTAAAAVAAVAAGSMMARAGRGRALTGLRTIIRRPGRRKSHGGDDDGNPIDSVMIPSPIAAAAADAVSVRRRVPHLGAAAVRFSAPSTADSDAVTAAALSPPTAVPSPLPSAPRQYHTQRLVADAVARDIAEKKAAAAIGSDPPHLLEVADSVAEAAAEIAMVGEVKPAFDAAGAASGGGGGGGGAVRRQMSPAEREIRLKEIFESIDVDEASETRSYLRRMAAAAAAAAAAAPKAGAPVAEQAAGWGGYAATTAEAEAAAARLGPPRGTDWSSTGSRRAAAAAAAATYGTGSRWDEQTPEDNFAGMAELLDFGTDYDRAVPERAAGGAVAAWSTVTADGSGGHGDDAVGAPLGAAGDSSVRGPSHHRFHDLTLGSVWLDVDSSGDEDGHHASTSFVSSSYAISVRNGNSGRGGGHDGGGSGAPPLVRPAPGTNPRTRTGLGHDLGDVLTFAADSGDSWNGNGFDLGSGGGAAGAAPGSSGSAATQPPLPVASATTGKAPSMYGVEEDELFGFDFSYVAPVTPLLPMQLLPTAPPPQLPQRNARHQQQLNPKHRQARHHQGPRNRAAAAEAAASTLPPSPSAGHHAVIAGSETRRKTGLDGRPSPSPQQFTSGRSRKASVLGEEEEEEQENVETVGRRRAQLEREKDQEWVQERERVPEAGAAAASAAASQVRFRKVTRGSSPKLSFVGTAADVGWGAAAAVDGAAAAASPSGATNEAGDLAAVAAPYVQAASVGNSTAAAGELNGADNAPPAIAFRRVARRGARVSAASPGSGGGGFDNGSGSSGSWNALVGDVAGSSAGNAASSSNAALFLQELLAPMRGVQQKQQQKHQQQGGRHGSISSGGGGDPGFREGFGGVDATAAAPAAAAVASGFDEGRGTGSRRSGGYLAPTQQTPTALQPPPEVSSKPMTPPPGGWKPRGTSETTLFVKGLDPAQGEELLREALAQLFSQAGRLVQIRLPCDSRRMPKGIAYIVFQSPEEKDRAVALDGSRLLGRVIRVDAEVDRPPG